MMLRLLLLLSCAGGRLEATPSDQRMELIGRAKGSPAANFLESFELPGTARLRPGHRAERLVQGSKPTPTIAGRLGSEDSAGSPRPECSIRVVRADPRLDPGIVRTVEPPVDAGMSVPSQCAN
jgi:hypothetical protein